MANIQLIENKIADDIFDAAYQIETKEEESSSYSAIFLSALSDLGGINARIITVGWILLAAGVGITINSFFGGSLAIAAVTIILGIPQLYQATSTISNRT